MKRKTVWLLLVCLVALCGCKQNPTEETLYAPLNAHFAAHGYAPQWRDAEEGRAVPIYNASVWKVLTLDGEDVLVYFDESNRADYQAAGIEKPYGFVGTYGLRFVLVYDGESSKVLEALNAMK